MKFPLQTLLVTGLLKAAIVSAHAQAVPAAQPEAPTAPVSAVPAAPAASDPTAEPLLPPALVKGKYKDYLYRRYATDKEARATIHMFGRKQTGGAFWLVGGAAVLGFITSQTGTRTNSSGTTTFEVSPLGYLVFGGLPAAISIGKFARFSNGELYKVLLDYDKTHTFPGYIIGKMGRSDYQ
ncbi:hypothetical protein IC235_03410 [Hymenobacter sp. BT664]|uniref:Uncharacterized protein n=1 Tax=Hymenobacter montanus TaxID=2771359 RepID=A0A927BB85_9BACT|nr:hypothetical protein [Hymenobacter montanus]MBD2766938.1 hypothetical protein [Hymenobacter montanus]